MGRKNRRNQYTHMYLIKIERRGFEVLRYFHYFDACENTHFGRRSQNTNVINVVFAGVGRATRRTIGACYVAGSFITFFTLHIQNRIIYV